MCYSPIRVIRDLYFPSGLLLSDFYRDLVINLASLMAHRASDVCNITHQLNSIKVKLMDTPFLLAKNVLFVV